MPPFTEETARKKVQAAEDAWNSLDPMRVAQAYTEDSMWRNRSTFLQGRPAIQAFLQAKWSREQNYRLKKHYFTHSDNKIAVTFQYEYQSTLDSKWYRAYGNEHWTFDDAGYMKERNASINDVEIAENERFISDEVNVERFSSGTFLG
eukprot:CAMPEP_0196588064 /NCGR_PEP_ID=MMETSP1081-20130531/59478_1 /TAXON_ID=36882 /ORGANISM="Pyramimonas amylifera, Strain CCMP720" /LENGTH=147 /DNA_ID=CAMNT_0041910451 /DNA_START=182 /DNA_END=625 /DNA_ORIENTATION=+